MELFDVGVNVIVFLFRRIEDDSGVMALDEGPTDGLYPNPCLELSLMLRALIETIDGKIGFSDILQRRLIKTISGISVQEAGARMDGAVQ